MYSGTVTFFILFAFLLVIFFSYIASLFRKDHYKPYEPDVSVVIPCYNEEKNIGECLDSVFSSDYPIQKLEVFVVDDGSKDNTKSVLESYQKKHKNLFVINGKHEGKSASLNLGVRNVKNEIILTIDADTIIEPDALKKLVMPFSDPEIGATNGSCVAKNSNSIISIFQKIEYHYNNLVRKSFSVLFKNGIWFFGAFACYRKSVLEKIGYFKMDTMTEDMDTAMEIYSAGYRTVNVSDALGFTIVPSTIKHFFKQRIRWWIGALQTLKKNKHLFSRKSSPSILFLFISQYWWSFYAFISFIIIAYQVYYWLPYNMDTYMSLFGYLFRWFSLAGPIYVLYKIPEWGVSFYNIFGVLSGIISILLIIRSVYLFKDRLGLKNIFGIFFYFPYTILLNIVVVLSIIKITFLNKKYFIY
jgi:cellulose synthase/poly-beta-1,6-N-acetylglucosamine synthase-like glycosyltransferase